MTDARTRTRRVLGRASITGVVLALLGVVVALVAIGVGLSSSQPTFVPEVTIDNPTDATVRVAVTSSPDAPALPLGTLEPAATRTFRSVVDQGDQWIFVFRWKDVERELPRSRAELERADWTIEIPQDVADAIHERYPPIPEVER